MDKSCDDIPDQVFGAVVETPASSNNDKPPGVPIELPPLRPPQNVCPSNSSTAAATNASSPPLFVPTTLIKIPKLLIEKDKRNVTGVEVVMAVLVFIEREESGWEGVINNGKYGEFMTKFSSLMFGPNGQLCQ